MSRLLDQVREAIRVRHYSIRTEEAYVGWIRQFILFHGKRHPSEMGEAEVNAFLTHLAVERKVAASTQNQALSALLFLYKEVLDRPLEAFGEVVRAQRPERLPVVLTREEVRAVLGHLDRREVAGRQPALRRGAAAAGVPPAAGQGRRLRPEAPDRPRRQGAEGPRRPAARDAGRAAAAADRARAGRPRAGPPRGVRPRLPARRPGGEIPRGRPPARLAVRLPGLERGVDPRSGDRPAAPPGRVGPCRRRSAGAVRRAGLAQAGQLPHLPPQLRHPPARSRPRHPHRPGTARPQRRPHHHDLYPRPPVRPAGRPQPARPALRPEPRPLPPLSKSVRPGFVNGIARRLETDPGASADRRAGRRGRGLCPGHPARGGDRRAKPTMSRRNPWQFANLPVKLPSTSARDGTSAGHRDARSGHEDVARGTCPSRFPILWLVPGSSRAVPPRGGRRGAGDGRRQGRDVSLVPALRVVMQSATLRVVRSVPAEAAAERPRRHHHAERGNE